MKVFFSICLLAGILLGWAGDVFAALSLRQNYSTYAAAQTGVVLVTGDLIIVAISYNDTLQTSTCTDNAGGGSNDYSHRVPGTLITVPVNAVGESFYGIAKASETVTITCTNQSDVAIHVQVVQNAGVTIGTVLDNSATGSSAWTTGNHYVGTALTPNTADVYLFTYWYQEVGTESSFLDDGTSFTLDAADKQLTHLSAAGRRVVSSIASYTSNVVTSGLTADAMGNMLLSFKESGGGGPTGPPIGTLQLLGVGR